MSQGPTRSGHPRATGGLSGRRVGRRQQPPHRGIAGQRSAGPRRLAAAGPHLGAAGRVGRAAGPRRLHADDVGNGGRGGRQGRRARPGGGPAATATPAAAGGGGPGGGRPGGVPWPSRPCFPTPTGNCSKTCRCWRTSTSTGRSTASTFLRLVGPRKALHRRGGRRQPPRGRNRSPNDASGSRT